MLSRNSLWDNLSWLTFSYSGRESTKQILFWDQQIFKHLQQIWRQKLEEIKQDFHEAVGETCSVGIFAIEVVDGRSCWQKRGAI